MKKAFTLIEMLIVVAVLVTLMTITFRLSSIGAEQQYRNTTIARMQRLENCLSGYYAAYGTYPPVKNHGEGNIYLKVDGHGMQSVDGEENTSIWGWNTINEQSEVRAWQQVEAACRMQPVAARFPFSRVDDQFIESLSAECQKRANSNESRYKEFWNDPETKARFSAGFRNFNVNSLSKSQSDDWRETQVFQFGLMSYLLPRYMVMLNVVDESGHVDESNLGRFVKLPQWANANNQVHDPFTGEAMNWQDVGRYACADTDTKDYARVSSIASQRICARWIPNLEEICTALDGTKYFGIKISGDGSEDGPLAINSRLPIYSYDGNGSSAGGSQYILNSVTVRDGWRVEFFYYSKPPYQSYTLWSAGPNKRTFPPWIDRNGLGAKENECVSKWVEDDIVHMSN